MLNTLGSVKTKLKCKHWWWQDFISRPHYLASLVSSAKSSQTVTLYTSSVTLVAMKSCAVAPKSQYFGKLTWMLSLLEILKSFHFLIFQEGRGFGLKIKILKSCHLTWLTVLVSLANSVSTAIFIQFAEHALCEHGTCSKIKGRLRFLLVKQQRAMLIFWEHKNQ